MSGIIFTNGKFQGIGNDGLVIPYGKLYFTRCCTGEALPTYRDSNLTSANTHPINLSSSGKADVFLVSGAYDVQLTDKNGVVVWTINNFEATSTTGGGGTLLPTVQWRENFVAIINQSSFTLSREVGTAKVYLNGSLLTPLTDYTSSSVTIVLVVPSEEGDEISVIGGEYGTDDGGGTIITGGQVARVSTVDDLTNIDTEAFTCAIVQEKGRGGTFNYEPDSIGTNDDGTIFNGWVREYYGAVQVEWFGASTESTNNGIILQHIFDNFTDIEGNSKEYKSAIPLDIKPFTHIRNIDLDLTSLIGGLGITTRVGFVGKDIRVRYGSGFSGVGIHFTTIDNKSSTSVVNEDSNTYFMENVIIQKDSPATGVAWDWYTDAAGIGLEWFGENNPDPIITSGFWGASASGIIFKGVWLDAMVVRDDGQGGWITSSSVRNVTIDGARRGITVESITDSYIKIANLLFDNINMQGQTWTKDGETDVSTEWVINGERCGYCSFLNIQPQDFWSAGISGYIRFGDDSSKNNVSCVYLLTQDAFQDNGFYNQYDTLMGKHFSNYHTTSGDPRTMDYYKRGTFTPTIGLTGSSPSYTAQYGQYSRIGDMVTFNIYVNVATIGGSPSGSFTIQGLPFSSSSSSNSFTAINLAYIKNIKIPSPYLWVTGYIGVGSSSITLQLSRSDSTSISISFAEVSNGTAIMVSGSYFCNPTIR